MAPFGCGSVPVQSATSESPRFLNVTKRRIGLPYSTPSSSIQSSNDPFAVGQLAQLARVSRSVWSSTSSMYALTCLTPCRWMRPRKASVAMWRAASCAGHRTRERGRARSSRRGGTASRSALPVVHLHGRDAESFLVDLRGVRRVRAGHAATHVGLVADGRREGDTLALEEDGLQHEDVGDVHTALERIVRAIDVAGLHAVTVPRDRRRQRIGKRREMRGKREPLRHRPARAVAERRRVVHVVAQDAGVRRLNIVSAISSAIDSVLRKARSRSGRTPCRITSPSRGRSMTMLPCASSDARAPGGITQVASYSSTMHGPSRGVVRSGRSMIGVWQPRSGPKYTRRSPPARPGPGRSTRKASGTRGRSGCRGRPPAGSRSPRVRRLPRDGRTSARARARTPPGSPPPSRRRWRHPRPAR